MPTLRVIDPVRARRQRLIIAGVWLASVLAAYVVGRYVMIPDAGGLSALLAEATVALDSSRKQLADVEQRLTIVERGEQIARLANENIQTALADKDGEIASLKRDLALYDRLIGSDAVRQGLTVFDVLVRPEPDGSAVFNVTLTQTQDVRGGSKGKLLLDIEGLRDGKLERIEWPALAAPGDEQGLDYDFRYFQRLQGRFLLPGGFEPNTILVRLEGRGGESARRSLSWDDVSQQGSD